MKSIRPRFVFSTLLPECIHFGISSTATTSPRLAASCALGNLSTEEFFFYTSNIRFFIRLTPKLNILRRHTPFTCRGCRRRFVWYTFNRCSYQTGRVVRWLTATLHQRPDEQKSHWPSSRPWTRVTYVCNHSATERRECYRCYFKNRRDIHDVWFESRTSIWHRLSRL